MESSKPVVPGDVVAVLSADGIIAYYGEVVPTTRSDGKIGVWNPDTDCVHYVAPAGGEGLRRATEEEAEDYLDGVVSRYGEDHEL